MLINISFLRRKEGKETFWSSMGTRWTRWQRRRRGGSRERGQGGGGKCREGGGEDAGEVGGAGGGRGEGVAVSEDDGGGQCTTLGRGKAWTCRESNVVQLLERRRTWRWRISWRRFSQMVERSSSGRGMKQAAGGVELCSRRLSVED